MTPSPLINIDSVLILVSRILILRLNIDWIVLVDFEMQRIVPDSAIKEQAVSMRPYGQWAKENPNIDLEDWAAGAGVKHNPM
jgi:hypothetical protein